MIEREGRNGGEGEDMVEASTVAAVKEKMAVTVVDVFQPKIAEDRLMHRLMKWLMQ